jgi:DNA-binding transcriptional LysR family regulator
MIKMSKSHAHAEAAAPAGMRGARRGVDLRSLEVFVHVCDSGSMTAAAARLGTTQSAVSRTVSQLERGLDAALLDRETRPLRPTPAGRVLLGHASGMLAAADRARAEVRTAAESPLPMLRLGLVDSVAGTLGPSLIHSLRRDLEEVRVWSGLSRPLATALLARELDLLVSADPLESLGELRVERLFREPFLLALPRGARGPAAPDVGELARSLPLVRYSLRSVTGAQVERYLHSLRVEVPRRMEFDASDSVVAMVQEGLGWAITTPLCLLQGHADFRRLRLHPLPRGAARRALFLASRDGEAQIQFQRLRTVLRRLLRELKRRVHKDMAPFAAAGLEVE